MIDLDKLNKALVKIDRLFLLGKAIARLANAHKKIIQKDYPNVLPPDLDLDFESILEDDVEPETKPDSPPPGDPS